MPWSLVETSGEDGGEPSVQLRFVRSRVEQQPSAYSLHLAQQQQQQHQYLSQHQQLQQQHREFLEHAAASPTPERGLPSHADPENAHSLPRGRALDRLMYPQQQHRVGGGGVTGGGTTMGYGKEQPSIFKPSIFGVKPRRQQFTFHGKSTLFSTGLDAQQQQHQLEQPAARGVSLDDDPTRRMAAGGGAATESMDGVFRLPLLPTDRIAGGKTKLRSGTNFGVRPSPRTMARPSPRDAGQYPATDALVVDRKGPLLTPRTQKEADMAVAREAQRKNLIMSQVKKLGNKDWASRKVAVDALASMCAEDSSVLEYVMALMDSRSDKSRQTAVWAVQRIVGKGHAGAVEMLLRRLESPEEEVRMAALSALSNVAVKGEAGAVEGALLRLRHREWTVREAAVDALHHVADEGDMCAIEGLAERVMSDKDWRVRQVAIEGMGGLVDSSFGSVRLAVDCFAACADAAGAEGPSMHMTLSCYRGMLAKCGVPPQVGQCSRGCRQGGGDDKLSCQACVAGVRLWASTKLWQGIALAFVMGSHSRLGQASWVSELDQELLPLILADV